MTQKRIAITGGIGSGKSYVSNLFSQTYDIPLYNTDKTAKEIMINDLVAKQKVIDTFGEDSYIDGQINKPKLSKLLFENEDNLKKMNSIIIPLIIEYFNKWCDQQKSEIVLLESAIIFENGIQDNFDFIICVVADMNIRIDRVSKRDNISTDIIFNKIKNQLNDELKINKSDFIIYNNSENNEDKLIYDLSIIYDNIK